MQANSANHGAGPALNEDEIENIINPSDSIIGGTHGTGLETDDGSHSVVEDIVNPSWDPAMTMSPGQLDHHTQNIAPFSPFMANSPLAVPPDQSNVIRRGTPVGLYQQQGSPSQPPATDSLLSDSILMPYRNRLLKPSKPKASSPQPPPRRKLTTTKTRPAFVNKLWSMVNDSANQKLIHWSTDGKSFVITNREHFVHEILPKYFKHSNFASFVRQLNMYGWHKVQDVRSGSIHGNSDERWQFENENFVRDCEDLLENIVRQKPSTNPSKDILVGQNGEEMDIGILLSELETVKFNQIAIAEDLKRMSKDNELLWKENMMARERHQAQQQALNKILHLLASLMGSNTQKLLGSDLVNELAQTNANLNDTSNVAHGGWDLANMNGLTRPRLLLKNRTPATSQHSSTGDLSSSHIGRSNSPIQEIDRGSIYPSNSSSSVGASTTPGGARAPDAALHSNSPVDTSFFNDLHSNIKKQGESIQELQDWITKMSPSQEELESITPEGAVPQQLTQPPIKAQQPHSKFDLQDYLSTTDPSALTPLLPEEPLVQEEKRSSDSDIEEISNPPKKQRTS
ncbi:LAQU0S08e04126g1_1 [Lachancea quebecensis]|uniref:Heat shock transcription factor n=1 Tax=Lachancea quebecensis TaxID=1654605 RepID=A0A0P1KT66_9SACH|nr:LAQU0S08e04126g1_1 [Lachancea quebecensis]